MSDTIPAAARVVWAGESRFDVGGVNGPTVRFDASGKTGPGPVTSLLAALGGCVSVDVVEILAKRRTPVESLTVDVNAERINATPRRVVSATLNFTINGAGIDRVHTDRAIDLALTKYCSVRDSLREDIRIDWTLTLNGEAPPSK